MREIVYTNTFKKDLKRMQKRNKDLNKLKKVLSLLIIDSPLPKKYSNHKLSGNYHDCWECHIEPDWLLIYRLKEHEIQLLELARTGSHSDLF